MFQMILELFIFMCHSSLKCSLFSTHLTFEVSCPTSTKLAVSSKYSTLNFSSCSTSKISHLNTLFLFLSINPVHCQTDSGRTTVRCSFHFSSFQYIHVVQCLCTKSPYTHSQVRVFQRNK